MKKILLILLFSTSLIYAKLILGVDADYTGVSRVLVDDHHDSNYDMNGGIVNFFIGYRSINYNTANYGFAIDFYNDFYKLNGDKDVPNVRNNSTDITLALHRETKRATTVAGVGFRYARNDPSNLAMQDQSMLVFHVSHDFHIFKYMGFVVGFRIAPYHGNSDKNTKVYLEFKSPQSRYYLNIGYLYRKREVLTYNHVSTKDHNLFIGVGYKMY